MNNILKRPPVPLMATRIHEPAPVDILQGVGGVLVNPRFFDLQAARDFDLGSRAERRRRVVLRPLPRTEAGGPHPAIQLPILFGMREGTSGRASDSSTGAGDPERRPNTIMIRHFKERWGQRTG